MFVRLRVQSSMVKKKVVGGLRLGSTKTLPRRDAWLALSQERYNIVKHNATESIVTK